MDLQNVLSRGVEFYFIAVSFILMITSFIFAVLGIVTLFFKYVGWLVGENNYDDRFTD